MFDYLGIFKQIDDILGHAAGGASPRQVARPLPSG
jgi:hypothetical protein